MDNEKDSYIKKVLRNDELISKKADDIFNEFLKGENINNMDDKEKVVDFNVTKEKRFKGFKRILAVAASLMLVFVSANVYAISQGYDNIFFMIKNTIQRSEEVTDRKEILSDTDLTISYHYISIADGLKIRISELIIQDNNAELFVDFKSNNNLTSNPKTCIVYDMTNGKIEVGKQEIDVDEYGNIVIDSIKLEGITDNTQKLRLEVIDDKNENITSLEIDLVNKEIKVVEGEIIELEKISEVELKKVLNMYAIFNSYRDEEVSPLIEGSKEDIINAIKVTVAGNFIDKQNYGENDSSNLEDWSLPSYDANEVHKVIKEMLGEDIKEPITGFADNLFYYNPENNRYESLGENPFYGDLTCIEISDIKYLDGIYTVTYVYSYVDLEWTQSGLEDISDFPLYRTTVKLKLNEDYEYTKYCIIDMDWEDNSNTEKFYDNSNINDKVDIDYDFRKEAGSIEIYPVPDGFEEEIIQNNDKKDDITEMIVDTKYTKSLSNMNGETNLEFKFYKPIYTNTGSRDIYINYIKSLTGCEEIDKTIACTDGSFRSDWIVLSYRENSKTYNVYLSFGHTQHSDNKCVCYMIDETVTGDIDDFETEIEEISDNFVKNTSVGVG